MSLCNKLDCQLIFFFSYIYFCFGGGVMHFNSKENLDSINQNLTFQRGASIMCSVKSHTVDFNSHVQKWCTNCSFLIIILKFKGLLDALGPKLLLPNMYRYACWKIKQSCQLSSLVFCSPPDGCVSH